MRKITTECLVTIILVMFLCGCGRKTVDYDMDENSEEVGSERNDIDVSEGLAEITVIDHWKEELVFDTPLYEDDLVRVDTMEIDTDVTMPNLERFPSVEAEEVKLDSEFRERFLKAFFRGEDVNGHEMSQYTKDEIREIIANLEENAKDGDLETQEMYEGFIKEYEELLEDAPDTPVEVREYTGSEYKGTIGEIVCMANFRDEDDYIWAGPDPESKYYKPPSIREFRGRISKEEEENIQEIGLTNECQFSMEEAKRFADIFMAQIGLSQAVCMKVIQPVWTAFDVDEAGNVTDAKTVGYGYVFVYGSGIEGLPFGTFEDRQSYVYGGIEKRDNGDQIKITVTDEGVLRVSIFSLMTIRTVEYGQEMLPLEEIKEIMKKEINENTERYNFMDSSVKCVGGTMELIYMKLYDTEEDGVCHYEPLWCLSGFQRYNHPVFVHAITGDVVYPFENEEIYQPTLW